MRVIIDQQLPPVLAEWLRGQGVEAFHVRELGLKDGTDAEIWTEASRDGSVVISRDRDFVRLLRSRGKARLVWLRIGNCDNPALISVFEARWPAISDRLELGDVLFEIRA